MTLSLRQRLLAGFGLGAVAALGQAPFDLPIILFLAFAGVIWLTRPLLSAWDMAWLGWWFGTGYFAVTMHWIISPFMVDVARHGWMAPFALVLLSGGLALFWALAFWLARRVTPRGWGLILFWPLAELARAYAFTGFPWAMPSQALINVIAGQGLAYAGPYVLNAVLIAVAACVLLRSVVLRAGVLGVMAFGLIAPPMVEPAPLTQHVIRLIQPNAAQHLKNDPTQIPFFYEQQLQLTAAPLTEGLAAPTAVIWSEAAIPWTLNSAPDILAEIQQFAGEKTVIVGATRLDGSRFYNALAVLDENGAVAQTYDKKHLVPFGEYVPFGNFAARFGIYGMASKHGFGHSSGTGPRLIDLGPLGKAVPLICYEAVFAHDANDTPERASLIIHISNDAWFGPGAGPKQHLAQAQMRAIEQGLPVARAANTGVSAMIDPFGRVTHHLPMRVRGLLDAPLPKPLVQTLYSQMGDLPFALLLMVISGVVLVRRRMIGQHSVS